MIDREGNLSEASARNLRIPGPTPLPQAVSAAMTQPMINHRGPQFRDILARVNRSLGGFLGTRNDVLVLAASGTGGLEAAVVNLVSPGDTVVAAVAGAFGERFAGIARAYGADVRSLDREWGEAIDPDSLDEALRAAPGVRAVLLTFNETSTGVTHPIRDLAAVARRYDALTLVDGVSGFGALPFFMDDWGVDAAVTSSQKAWMTPPGLAMIALSERAWNAAESGRSPRFYWDLRRARTALADGSTPFTPAISLIYGLSSALDLMEAEGRGAVWRRHADLGAFFRAGVQDIGLRILPPVEVASNSVTAVRVPRGHSAPDLIRSVRERYGIEIAGGQGKLRDDIIRVGHMGYVQQVDLEPVLEALRAVVREDSSVPAG